MIPKLTGAHGLSPTVAMTAHSAHVHPGLSGLMHCGWLSAVVIVRCSRGIWAGSRTLDTAARTNSTVAALRASCILLHERPPAACTIRASLPAKTPSRSRLHEWDSPSVPSDPLCDRTSLVILSVRLGCATPTSSRTPYPSSPPRRNTEHLPVCPDTLSAAKARERFPQCQSQRRWQRRVKEGCSAGAATTRAMSPPCVDWCLSLQTCAMLERES